MSDLIGTRLADKYEIQTEIGRGGMGIVYRGFDLMLERPVAIKVLPSEMTFDQKFVARFRQEAVMAANLHHPNIVVTYDVGQQNGIYYIVMQFLPGRTLDQWLVQYGPMPLAHMVHVLQQIGSALDYAHLHNIIHRDIKPSNIMLDDDGHATLMDFGLVRAGEGAGLTRQDVVVGTPDYIAPEQATGGELDHRADIYSLGVVVFRSLAGQAPFVRSTPLATVHAHVYEPPPPLRQLRPDLPRSVEAVVLKALAKKPADRFQKASQFAQELAQVSSKGSSSSPTLGPLKLPKLTVSPRQGTTVVKGPKSSPQAAAPIAAPPPSGGSPTQIMNSASPPSGGSPTQIMNSAPPPSGGEPAQIMHSAPPPRSGAATQVVAAPSGLEAKAVQSAGTAGAAAHSSAQTVRAPAQPRTQRRLPARYASVLAVLAFALLAAALLLRPQENKLPAATATRTPTTTPTRVVTDTTPTYTHTPTYTSTYTPTYTPTLTQAPTYTHTPTPTSTFTPTATRRPITPTPRRTPGAGTPVSLAPRLIAPAPGEQVRSDRAVEFVWSFDGKLAENQGFEVRVWKEGQPHYGATSPVLTTRTSINLSGAYGVQQGGSGRYQWTVAVVQLDPYLSLGPEAAAQEIEIQVVGGGVPTPRS